MERLCARVLDPLGRPCRDDDTVPLSELLRLLSDVHAAASTQDHVDLGLSHERMGKGRATGVDPGMCKRVRQHDIVAIGVE